MTARPKWCTEQKNRIYFNMFISYSSTPPPSKNLLHCFYFSHSFFLFYATGSRFPQWKLPLLIFRHLQHRDHLPKSIPSDTFPLATDRRMAPLPFSHAWRTETNEERLNRRRTGTSVIPFFIKWNNHRYQSVLTKFFDLCSAIYSMSKRKWQVSLWPPGISPGPCSFQQHLEFQWRSACFSEYSPGFPAKTQNSELKLFFLKKKEKMTKKKKKRLPRQLLFFFKC